MSSAEEDRKRAARAERVALFRYQLIREAADPALTVRQRGRLVRELAARAHEGPFGDPVVVSRATIDRWIRAWKAGGFAALAPPARQVMLRTDAAVLELAAGLKREKPERTAAQVLRILRTTCGWSPSVRTLQRHFERLELTARPDGPGPCRLRPVRVRAAERDVDRRRPARPAHRRPQGLPVLLPGRSFPCGDGGPLGVLRGHGAAGCRAAPGAGRQRRPCPDICRQRISFRRRGAETGRGQAGDQDHPQRARPPPGAGENRTVFPDSPGRIPGRDRRRVVHQGPGGAEPAVHRLVRDGLPCPAARRDRAAADGPVAGRRPVPGPGTRAAAGGVLVVRDPAGPQGRHGPPVRRRLRDRPGAGRPEGRVRLRPIRPVRPGDPLERLALRAGGPPEDRPALPSQGETRGAGHPAAGDRDRLPRASSPPSTPKPARRHRIRYDALDSDSEREDGQ